MATPHEHYPGLAKAIGCADLYFKREDIHPYGSHKGRSIPVMIKHYHDKGDRRFVISSSGNAALAAALYVREFNAKSKDAIELTIFVGNHIAKHKLDKLDKLAYEKIRILKKERPLQALSQAVSDGYRSLRQSTDDIALIGYESLARELAEIKDAGAIFIGASSGATAQALARYFLNKKLPIQVHIVQTSSCHPIVDVFESFDKVEEKSIADAIVDYTAHRKAAVVPLIEKTGGRGWRATNDDIQAVRELTKKHTGLDISTNSALSIVGVMQAVYVGHKFNGSAVCVICGD